MGSVDLVAVCHDAIRQIASEITGAILYLDAGSSEAFQFMGAFPLLLELQARAICNLEEMSPLDAAVAWNSCFTDHVTKLVIITSCLLSDAHRYILRCLGAHKTINNCTIYTSVSEIAHSAYVDSPLGSDAYREYESLLTQDFEELLKKQGRSIETYAKNHNTEHSSEGTEIIVPGNLTVSVHHFPMIICPISSRVFVTPSEGTVADSSLSVDYENSVSPGLPSISTGTILDSDEIPPGAVLTAHFLYHLADKMDLKCEIFSLGDTSKAIGKTMMDMSTLYDVGRRSRRSAGLLLVDRTLDLLTPCCHGDSFLDRIISSLPRKEKAVSPSSARSSQVSNISSYISVKRSPLDIRIPLDIILDEDPDSHVTQLSESISAFMSAWNSQDGVSEPPGLVDCAETTKGHEVGAEVREMLCGSFLSNYFGASYLEALLDRGAKDGVTLIKKWILEALQREKATNVSRNPQYLASPEGLRAVVKILSQSQSMLIRNRGVIKLALAAEIARHEPQSSRWDAFVSAERILSVTSAESSQSLSSEIRDFINTSTLSKHSKQNQRTESSHGLLSLQDALMLSVIGYILAGECFPSSASNGPFSWEEEHHLKEAVIDCILENPLSTKFRFLDGLENELAARANVTTDKDSKGVASNNDDFDENWDSWGDDDDTDNQNDTYRDMQFKLELRDRVDQLFKFFHNLSCLKLRNPTLREGLAALSRYETDNYNRKGLLYKLLCTVLSKFEVPGLEYHSSTVGRLFKGGFGRLLTQAKPSIGDHDILIIYVVGGINMLEVREAIEALSDSNRPDLHLIIGGTTLLTPDDMFELMLGSQSFSLVKAR